MNTLNQLTMEHSCTTTSSLATTEALYDLSMLEEMDDTAYLLEMLSIFLRESPKDILEMREALLGGNIGAVCKKAHKLKGSAGIIQAQKLKMILEDIEAAEKKGIADHNLTLLVENAGKEFDDIEKALKTYIKTLK